MIRLAVDTKGGDFGPETTVYGACLAMHDNPELSFLLFGLPDEIEQAIPDFADRGRLEIISAEEEITDDDNPLKAIRKKQDSSIVKGLKAVAEGSADAFVSAGSSGAIYAGSLLHIGLMPDIKRPAAVSILPTVSKTAPNYLLIDSGANTASKPEHLVQYGKLGSDIAGQLLGVENPRVGLLNIGSEASKGNDFTKTAHQLLETSEELNFTGNVEPNVLLSGTNDVVLSDGFTGNIMLKSVEGTAEILMNNLLNTVQNDEKLDENAVKAVEDTVRSSISRYTNEDIGGGFILGIKAPVIITHGAADRTMFKHSVEIAARLADSSTFST